MSVLAAVITSTLSSAAPPPAPPPTVSGPVRVQRARPLGDYAMLIRPWDYPARAMAAGEEGRVGYVLDIGPDGRVTGCGITRSSGSTALDEGTCTVLRRRARFAPARGISGEPLADRVRSYIDWRLEDPWLIRQADQLPRLIRPDHYPVSALEARQEGTVGVRLEIAGDGRLSRCTVTESSGVPALDARTCSVISARATFPVTRDREGRLQGTTMSSRVIWRLPPPDATTQPVTIR